MEVLRRGEQGMPAPCGLAQRGLPGPRGGGLDSDRPRGQGDEPVGGLHHGHAVSLADGGREAIGTRSEGLGRFVRIWVLRDK